MGYSYLYLSGSDYVSIIPTHFENKTGEYYRQKALITYNTENYQTRNFSLTLKSGRKIFFEGSYLGVKASDDSVITRIYIPNTDSGYYMYLVYRSNGDTYHLYATRGEVAMGSNIAYGGIFRDNIGTNYSGGTSITWNDFIANWPTYSRYPYNLTYFAGLSFSSETGDVLLAWDSKVSTAGPYNALYAIDSLYSTYDVDITNAVAPEDFGNIINFQVSTDLTDCTADPNNPTDIAPTATSTLFKFVLDSDFYFDQNSAVVQGDGYPSGTAISYTWLPSSGSLHIGRVTSNVVITVKAYPSPYSGGGESEPNPGGGTHDVTTKPIPFQETPVLGALNAGFVTLYSPNMAQLQSLARYMWAGAFDVNNFKKLFADPMDAILGLSILPVTDEELGCDRTQGETICVGNLSTGVGAPLVKNQYVEVYCGSVHLRGVWGAYLDYSPYTKIQLYLPYIGFVELNPDDCMNTMLTIKYSIDVYSGSCLAQIFSSVLDESVVEDVEIGHVLYEFAGNCASWYPITAGQYQNFIVSGYNIVTGVGMGALQIASGISDIATAKKASGKIGGVAQIVGGADNAIRSVADNVTASIKPVVQRSGGPGGSSFMMGHQYPYLIITIPRMIIPGKQNQMIGYPSYVTCNLGELNGFTSVESIHIKGIEATREEIEEISELLKNGVFL